MTEASHIVQTDLLCPNCAGQCIYAPEAGALKCQSCGSEHAIVLDEDADPAKEQHYHPDLPHTEQPRFTQDRPYQCGTCAGEVVFQGHSFSEHCPYCNGSLVEISNDESYQTLGVIPFSLTQSSAQERA